MDFLPVLDQTQYSEQLGHFQQSNLSDPNAIEAVRKRQMLQEYVSMRASFKARILELERFYDDYSDYDQAPFFESLRLKLKKTLQRRLKS